MKVGMWTDGDICVIDCGQGEEETGNNFGAQFGRKYESNYALHEVVSTTFDERYKTWNVELNYKRSQTGKNVVFTLCQALYEKVLENAKEV